MIAVAGNSKCGIVEMMAKLIFIILCLIPLAWSTKVNANYFTTKSFLLYLVGGLSFLYAAFQKNPLRLPTHPWKWIALFFIGLQLLYAVSMDFPAGLFYLPKFLSLVGVVFFLIYAKFDLTTFFKKYEWLILGFFGILFILTAKGYTVQMDSEIPFQSWYFIYPFGNVNMLAEFYVLCVPLIYFWIKQKSDLAILFKGIVLILIHVVLISTQSRSALLGLSLWWVFFILDHFRSQRKVLIGLSVAALIAGGIFLYKTDLKSFMSKSSSTTERMNFYRSAVDLIQDRPLGVGSQYANQIMPYRLNYTWGPQETEYPDQPHSEILKWGVEFGWLGLVTSLLCLGLMTWQVGRQGSFLLRGAGLVILPQLFFQFPFENPASIVMLAVYLYLFAQSLPQQQVRVNRGLKILGAVAGIGIIYFAVIFIVSVYDESNYPNSLEKTTRACRLNPSYLRGCVRKNYNLLQSHQVNEIKHSLKEDMRLNYYAADYLKVLHDAFSEGIQEPDLVMQDESLTSISVYDSAANQSRISKKTCQIIHVYAFIYKDQKYFSADDIKACQDVAPPFEMKISPGEFDREYRVWLAQLLK
jgi:O-antigen ligase